MINIEKFIKKLHLIFSSITLVLKSKIKNKKQIQYKFNNFNLITIKITTSES